MPKKSNKARADGRIAVQVYLGTENKKRKYKTVYGRTQKEADAAAEELRRKLGKGIDVTREDDSFKTWRDNWLTHKKAEVSESEYNLYNTRSEYFVSAFGGMAIKNVSISDIQKVINELATQNPHTNKPTAKRTLTRIGQIAEQIFDYAIRCRIVDYNPAAYVEIPKKAPIQNREAITDEQMKWIEETPHRAQTAAMIMMYAGLRRGELTALLWTDIDFKNSLISVNKSFDFKADETKEPKTQSGKRAVPLPDVLAEYLLSIPKTSVFVFPSANNTRMSETAWRTLWESYMCDLNLKYGCQINKHSKFDPRGNVMSIETFTPHQLRHTYCTMLFEADVDEMDAKEFMGHSDIKTTLSVYTHLRKTHKQKNANKLNDFLKCKSDASQEIPQALDK